MKHSYRDTCDCLRCQKERMRRTSQAASDPRRHHQMAQKRKRWASQNRIPSRKPAWGSQEWAETRGDDIPSYDVPGDDRD
jgi:hypothetical protein